MMQPYNALVFWFLLGIAYLLGSIPWGLFFTRMFTEKDIRKQGSGNIGATNVRRIAGVMPGILTLFADMAKGAIPVFFLRVIMESNTVKGELLVALVALAAFMGHLYPCFLKFKGGKGVATAAGCFLVISPLASGMVILVFMMVVGLSNRVSPGSLSAAVALPLVVWWTDQSIPFTGAAAVMAVFIILRHRENIRRIFDGSEPFFREKK
jgi:glycerol-3-phosphate acyltransferase PlsY